MTNKKIGRRQILGGLATGTATLGLSAQAPAYATGKRRLKMVTTWAKNFPGLGTAPENIAKRVRDMTDGQLDIKIYAAGELV
ncbi:MAG: ABC transporter substrate-binding protein, partial [Pseudomonadota bacterium]|nr:ABC transporter substrate-binding protein [Pseudomonadota bacterium]